MDFDLSEEERAVADLAREILADRCSNERLKEHEAGGAPRDEGLWRTLAGANLLGTAIPEAHGGSELGLVALGALLVEAGRAVAPVPLHPALALGALPLARFGSEAQRARWLPAIARGECVVTAALSEYDSSDPLAPMVRAEDDAETSRLSGVKAAVPCGEQAALILVPARSADGRAGVFAVEPGAEGVRLAAQQTPDGLPHAELSLDGARASGRLGADGEGEEVLRWLVERATALRCLGRLRSTQG